MTETSAGKLYSDITDHYPLFQVTTSCFQNSTPLQKTFITRNINDNSLLSFNFDLINADWSAVYDANDADVAYDSFLSTFTCHYNHHFPYIKKTVGKSKRNQPWITQSIVNSCLLKNKLHR